jgi:hypothetical protein
MDAGVLAAVRRLDVGNAEAGWYFTLRYDLSGQRQVTALSEDANDVREVLHRFSARRARLTSISRIDRYGSALYMIETKKRNTTKILCSRTIALGIVTCPLFQRADLRNYLRQAQQISKDALQF